MGTTSIGKLNLMISASTAEFEKALTGAEKRLTGFAAKAASPLTTGMNIGGQLKSTLINPLMALANPVGAAISAAAGGGLALMEAGFGNVKENTAEAVQHVRQLQRESQRLGISPAFLRGMQLAAGAESESVVPLMGKFEKFMGKLRSDPGLQKQVGKFMNVGELLGKNPRDQIMMVADAMSGMGDVVERNAMLFQMMGREGIKGFDMLKGGAEGLAKAEHKAEGMAETTPGAQALAGKIAAAEKKFKLAQMESRVKGMYVGEAVRNEDLEWEQGNLSGWMYWKFAKWNRRVNTTATALGGKRDYAKEYMDGMAGSSQENTAKYDSAAEAVHEYIDLLDKQTAALGKTSDALELERLKLEGATVAQLAAVAAKQQNLSAEKLLEQIREERNRIGEHPIQTAIRLAGLHGDDANRVEIEARQVELEKFAADAVKDLETPLDRAQKKLTELNAAFRTGGLTQEQFAIATGRVVRGLGGLGNTRIGSPKLISEGSQEAAALMDDIKNNSGPVSAAEQAKAILEKATEQVRLQKEQLEVEKEVARQMKDAPLVRVGDFGGP